MKILGTIIIIISFLLGLYFELNDKIEKPKVPILLCLVLAFIGVWLADM